MAHREPEQQGPGVNPVQIQKFLKGIDYPADKNTVVDAARKNGADSNVIDTLDRLSMDRFNSPNDISEAIGKLH